VSAIPYALFVPVLVVMAHDAESSLAGWSFRNQCPDRRAVSSKNSDNHGYHRISFIFCDSPIRKPSSEPLGGISLVRRVFFSSVSYMFNYQNWQSDNMTLVSKSPEPTAVGAGSSASRFTLVGPVHPPQWLLPRDGRA